MSVSMTLCEKILARASGREQVVPGDFLWPEPDLVLMHEFPGLSDEFARILRDELKVNVRYPERCKLSIDHLTPPSGEAESDFHHQTRKWAKEQGVEIMENGIGHQVMAESGLVKPGQLIVHGDLHVHVLGAFNTLPISLLTDLISAYALGKFWFEVPETIRVNLRGRFQPGVDGRDLINCMLGDMGPDGGLGAVLEFGGDGADHMGIDDRMAMLCEVMFCGAYTGIFPASEVCLSFLCEHGVKEPQPVYPDAGARYKKTISYDLSAIEPYVIGPLSLSDARPIKEAAGTKVQQGYIGSCAGGRVSDLEIAARILKGKKIRPGFRLFVVPSSREILIKAIENQTLATLVEAGAFISSPSCDYCYGKTQSISAGETAISTGALNVPGRMGSAEASIYLASAATVAASAIQGVICDPREFLST